MTCRCIAVGWRLTVPEFKNTVSHQQTCDWTRENKQKNGNECGGGLKWKGPGWIPTRSTDLASFAAGETVKGWIWAAASGTSQLFLIWTWPADDPPVGEMELWKNKSTGTEPSERRDEPRDKSDEHLQRQKQQWTVYFLWVKKRTVYTLQKRLSHSVFSSCLQMSLCLKQNDYFLFVIIFWVFLNQGCI